MNTQLTATMDSSLLRLGSVPAPFAAPRLRPPTARRGKRETMAMRVALAVGGPRIARRRTCVQACKDAVGPARRLAGVSAVVALIVIAETTLSVLSR